MRPVLLAITALMIAGGAQARSEPAAQYSVEDLAARLAAPATPPALQEEQAADPAAPAADASATPATPDAAPGENAQRGFFIVGAGSAPTRAPAVTRPPAARAPAAPRRVAPAQASRAPAPTPPRQGRTDRPANARTPAPASAAIGPAMDLMIGFEFGSATLTPQARANADVLAQALRSPAFDSCDRLLIEGHTDRSGGRAFNLALSKRRADAVVDRLVAAGVPRTRLESSGRGFDVPRDPSDPGAATNRRVEGRCIG